MKRSSASFPTGRRRHFFLEAKTATKRKKRATLNPPIILKFRILTLLFRKSSGAGQKQLEVRGGGGGEVFLFL